MNIFFSYTCDNIIDFVVRTQEPQPVGLLVERGIRCPKIGMPDLMWVLGTEPWILYNSSKCS